MIAHTNPLLLKDIVAGIRLPACPLVFIQLTRAIQEGDQPSSEVANTISMDPALTAHVLRVANSAMYGHPRRIHSISEATLRLGCSEIYFIATALKARDLFTTSLGKFGQTLWEHSLKTGVLARGLCRRRNGMLTDAFFTAGILHDLGKLILQQVTPSYMLLCEDGAVSGSELVARETAAFGTHHAALGGELLDHWGLPETLVKLVAEHHDPQPDPNTSRNNSHGLLAAANEMAHTIESGAPLMERKTTMITADANERHMLIAEFQRQMQILRAS